MTTKAEAFLREMQDRLKIMVPVTDEARIEALMGVTQTLFGQRSRRPRSRSI